MITAKFGGTSLCDAAHFQMVRDILALKEERRFVVVSAPGKRFPEDIKITDQLYRCHEEARQGGNVAEAFTPVASRFQEIAAQLGLSLDLEEEFRATLWAMERGAGLLRQPGRILQRQDHGGPSEPPLSGSGSMYLF